MKDKISEKEQFFSKVSHDLRGSFTSILGFSDILNDPNEILTIDEINEFSKRIQVQSKDTFDLLVNFINWLKLEKFAHGLSAETIELFDALLETKNIFNKMLIDKNIEVKISLLGDEIVLMDYEIFLSILNNLFSFLIRICGDNSTLLVKSIDSISNKTSLEISATCDDENFHILQHNNLRDLNSEYSFPIIFTIKFIELSGGTFDFSFDKKNNLILSIQLPKEQKN